MNSSLSGDRWIYPFSPIYVDTRYGRKTTLTDIAKLKLKKGVLLILCSF